MKIVAQTKVAQFDEHRWMDHMGVPHMNGAYGKQRAMLYPPRHLFMT